MTHKNLLWLGSAIITLGLSARIPPSTAAATEPTTGRVDAPLPVFKPLTPEERAARLARVQEGLRASVTDLEKRLAAPDYRPTTRDLPNGALAKLILGDDPRGAEKLVEKAFAAQDMDKNSPSYGDLPWAIGNKDISDLNATEFGTQAIAPMLRLYGERLSFSFKKELEPHLRAAFVAMRRRVFRTPAYTNIFLMRLVNLILLGEALGDNETANYGYSELDRWIAYTREAGIHEFDSPTYYGVDLNCLGLGYRFAARPEAHKKFKAILDYFWTDIAANLFPAHGSIAGPNSRNYDFLHSTGGLDLTLYTEGLRNSQNTNKLDFEKTFLLVNEVEQGYHPAASILALSALPERILLQRFDKAPDNDRYHYVTPDFALGSACANYGPQDKLITIELASPAPIPVLAVVPDVFDQPYGTVKRLDRSGHSKPIHLPLNPTTVQHKGALLALLDLDASKAAETDSLATNILLPATADALRLDGKPVTVQGAFAQPAHVGSVIGVRVGHSGVAIRLFAADACAGQSPRFVLQADPEGLKHQTARYTVYHYQGAAQKLRESHLRVGVLIVAATCDSDAALDALLRQTADAKVEPRAEGNRWEVKATLKGVTEGRTEEVTLEAACDMEKRVPLTRRVNGAPMPAGRLTINGQDIAARLLDPLPLKP